MLTFKPYHIRFLVYLFLALVYLGCGGDDSGTTMAGVGELRARINSGTFSASGEEAQAFLFNNELRIIGRDVDNGENITLTVGTINEAGTFDLGTNEATFGTYTIDGEEPFTTNILQGNGTLTIDIFNLTNQLLTGSFEFTGSRPGEVDEMGEDTFETQLVRDGSFTALELQFGIPNNPANTFMAMVNEQAFTPTAVEARTVMAGNITSLRIIALDTENDKSISLSFPIETTGNHTFDGFPDLGSITGQYTPDTQADDPVIYIANGTINITSNAPGTQMVSGSFQFTASDLSGMEDTTFQIMQGVFTVVY